MPNRLRQRIHSHVIRYSRRQRILTGIALIVGGILGFLPILGFWMLPLGVLVLSYDLAAVRRWRRRLEVRWGRRGGRQKPSTARGEADRRA